MAEESLSFRAIAADRSSGPIHALRTTGFAYAFVARNFWQLARVSFVPLLFAGLSLYAALRAYLAYGLHYLQTGDARAASLGLVSIVAGLMAAVFFYGVAVARNAAVAMTASASARAPAAHRHVYWRTVTSYTRLLLCALVVIMVAAVLPQGVSRFASSGMVMALTGLASVLGLWWLFVRAGFLLPAIAFAEHGPVLRRGWSLTFHHTAALGSAALLLAIPGIAVEVVGEFLLRTVVTDQTASSLFEYIAAVGQVLVWFVLVLSAAAFLNITLLTAASVYAYRLLVPEPRRG